VAGDYWLIPARTLTGKVEWPRDGAGNSTFEARHGTRHHYAALAVVSFTGGAFAADVLDCRKLFPPLTAIKASDVSYAPGACATLQGAHTVQEALDTLCQSTGGSERGIHVKGVFLASNDPLVNDALLPPAAVLKGIRVDCDERLFEGSVVNKHGLPNPLCTVTVELPWPLRAEERQFWAVDAGAIIGYQPIVLGGEVVVRENAILWTPLAPAQKWLSDRLLQMYQEMTNEQNPRVLVRLRLRGSFIWGPERDPKLYLDGEGFGLPGGDNVDVKLPSGDGRRGGDFEMWFWFGRVVRQVVPGVGFIPSRASRFFVGTPTAPGTPVTGRDALQLAIDRGSADLKGVLPADYAIDATQRFSAADSVAATRRLGVQQISGLVSDRFARLGKFLTDQLQANMRVTIAVETLPDAQVLERVRAGIAAGGPPDFVFADEALSARLQQIAYSTDFIRV